MFTSVVWKSWLTCLIYISTSIADEEGPVLTLPHGKIRGRVLESENNAIYYAYQEIPYASPPIKDLRFKDPTPPRSWGQILDTTQNTKICHQQNLVMPVPNVNETEDCLYLNVYTPETPGVAYDNLLPVLFWIHGGGYINGGGTYQQHGPKFFIDYDIVVVTINYRLGPLGFLTTGDEVIPGNLGLKDQNMALQWVHDNIKLFGGDPEKVTIAGEDAGAFSVSYHIISEKSKGLFRAAIQQSGTSLSPVSYQPFYKPLAFQLGKALDANFSSDNSTDLLNLLNGKSAEEIVTAKIAISRGMDNGGSIWSPIIEKEGPNAFITRPMYELLKDSKANHVPLLLGFNSEEEVFFGYIDLPLMKRKAIYYDQDLSRLVRVAFNMAEGDKKTAGSELRSIYTNNSFHDDFGAFISFMSDFVYTTPIIRDAHLQSQYTDVYLYQLSYKGTATGMNIRVDGVNPSSVAHYEDLLYLWEMSLNSVTSLWSDEDILTRKRMLTMWTNFVKHLNPTPDRDPLLPNTSWTKVSSEDIEYLDIGNDLEVRTEPKQYKSWKKIIDDYAIPPLTVY